jgi:hypothetical protein
MTRFAGVVLVVIAGCSSTARPAPRVDVLQQRAAARPAIAALRIADFPRASWESAQVLRGDRTNAVAAVVRALATYQAAGHRLRGELVAIADAITFARPTKLDHARGRKAWREFAAALAKVEADLEIAAGDPELALELCLACWEHDWNASGAVDENDRLLFQVERDATGNALPPDDPRRTPTFRFDVGDVSWARAMIAFQRGAVELILAYRWDQIDRLFALGDDVRIVIELADRGRVGRARELFRAGLAHSDRSRELYLAETDDDREWVPNPRQKDHAVPLQLDAAMYATWAAVTRDLRALLDGREGLPLAEAGGDDVRGMSGILDLGRLFDHPQDIVIDLRRITSASAVHPLGRLIEGAFGHAIVHQMPLSPLAARLRRMAGEIDRGEDTFEQKLRYFLWIN